MGDAEESISLARRGGLRLVLEGEAAHPEWVSGHRARATWWVRATTIFILPEAEDSQIYSPLGGEFRALKARDMAPVIFGGICTHSCRGLSAMLTFLDAVCVHLEIL
jgi:hypothetical protein